MKKVALSFLGLLAVSSFAFAADMEVAGPLKAVVAAEGKSTFGYDLDTGYYGIHNAASASLYLNLIGDVNEGWRLAKVTLGNERVSLSGEGALWGRGPSANDLVNLAKGQSLTALQRESLVKCWSHGEILRLLRIRTLSAVLAGREPGPEASVRKALADDHGQEIMGLAVEFAGIGAMDASAGPFGLNGSAAQTWRHGFLYAQALTIGGGTSVVQRNIIAERVLQLPKELSV
jgi:alkylation response protein AidB-like acyl-CoA dehydrogenase